MHNHDDVNFECLRCGDHKYLASNVERIQKLTDHVSGYGRPTCPICGQVSVPNNGGFSCLKCSGYYETPNGERPEKITLMRRRSNAIPDYLVAAMILLTINLVVAGALFFGG